MACCVGDLYLPAQRTRHIRVKVRATELTVPSSLSGPASVPTGFSGPPSASDVNKLVVVIVVAAWTL